MEWRNLSILEYIHSEDRGFFLPDMAANGLALVGYQTYEIYNDPKKQLELAMKMHELFEADFTYSLSDGVIFCEALGLEILKPEYDLPSVMSHPVATIQDIQRLKVPDPHEKGRMPVNLKSLELIATNIDKPLYVSIQGPFTLAVQLAGATHLLRSIIRHPEYVEMLLDFTKETVKAYAIAANQAGAQYISISEPGTVTLSPERFKKFVVPRVNEILDNLKCWRGMHICGDTTHFLDLMLECNLDAVSLDQIMDYTKIAPRVPKEIVLIGNLDPIELLGRGTPKEIREATFKLREQMKPYQNYLCALGCNCLNQTPVENLQAAIEAARTPHREFLSKEKPHREYQ